MSARGDGVVMAIRHRELPAEGVQFHPESVLTDEGMAMLAQLPPGDDVSELPNERVTAALDAVASGRDLDADEAAAVLAEIMHGDGLACADRRLPDRAAHEGGDGRRARRARARDARARGAGRARAPTDLLDTAGTGGGRGSFNVSTTAALIAAGAGCAVAKHGNRSATSQSGSADVLEALGARIDLDAAAVARCIDEAGFGFMFAPAPPPGDAVRRRASGASSACGRSSTCSAR